MSLEDTDHRMNPTTPYSTAEIKTMQINLQTDLLKADGFTDDEIESIRKYVEAAPFMDNLATVVRLRGEIKLVCRTVGLAIKAVRPELYLGTVEEATSGSSGD